MEINSSDDVKAFALSRLADTGIPAEAIRAAALDLGFERQATRAAVQPGSLGLVIPKFRWIIRDDDLKVLDAVVDGFKTAAGVGFFLHAIPPAQLASAGAGILTAVTRLVRQARKKGARVSDEEFRMLILLKANSTGLTPAEIASVWSRSTPISEDEIRRVLGRLAKNAVADGSTAAFVAEDGAGRWHAAGV